MCINYNDKNTSMAWPPWKGEQSNIHLFGLLQLSESVEQLFVMS